MNSVVESIYNKVPLLVFPQGADQFIVAKTVSDLNLGFSINDSSLDSLRESFSLMCSNFDEYKTSIEQYSKKLNPLEAKLKLLDWIKSKVHNCSV